MKSAFGSSGGKSHVAKKIVSLIPEHRVFIENFVGGGAVFWNKSPSEVEVLNDKDSEIAFAYNFIKNVGDEDIKRLRKYNWGPDRELFIKLRDSKIPEDQVKRFYRFYYTLYHSYGYGMKDFGNHSRSPKIFNRLGGLKDRLKVVKIYNKDFGQIIDEYDAEDCFFFIDPPYLKEWAGPKDHSFNEDDFKRLEQKMRNLKGRFILTVDNSKKMKELFKGFHIKKLLFPRKLNKLDKPEYELLISNFELKSESKYSLSEDEILSDEYTEVLNLMDEELIELIEDIREYDPSSPNNSQLRDDYRIASAWWATYKDPEKKIKFSREDIINIAKIIYEEIERRKKEDKMTHIWNPKAMTENSRELYEIITRDSIIGQADLGNYAEVKPSKDHKKGRAVKIEELKKGWQKPIILIKNYIKSTGGICNHPEEGTTGDFDMLINKAKPGSELDTALNVIDSNYMKSESDETRAVLRSLKTMIWEIQLERENEDMPLKFRLYRSQPTDIGDRLHWLYLLREVKGPFTSHYSMYDLALIPSQFSSITEMSGDMVEKESGGLEKREHELVRILTTK